MEVLLLFVMIVGLLLIGVPIAVSLGFSSIFFLLVFSDTSLASIAAVPIYLLVAHWSLLYYTLFVGLAIAMGIWVCGCFCNFVKSGIERWPCMKTTNALVLQGPNKLEHGLGSSWHRHC